MQKTLTLANGTKITGKNFGADCNATGEVVFSTGMSGYSESFTDPSFTGQILVLTYPLIGNYGVPAKIASDKWKIASNFESEKIQIAGLVVSEYSEKYSHSQAKENLSTWLKREKIPAITDVDTRELTQYLRGHGTILGKLEITQKIQNFFDPAKENLVARVSPKKPRFFKNGKKTVAILDCGMKLGILREFLDRGVSVWHLPYNADLTKFQFDGLFISNGPSDPRNAKVVIDSVRQELKKNNPIFGICLGHQILALAAGSQIFKLPYGHRSQNQPVRETKTSRCFITSQNHGYAVKNKMPPNWQMAFENLNDGSVEGLAHKTKPFFSVQFHPEAKPGPTDTRYLFDEFVEML
jgi:carbamoyl-phosphate synthase small subunit